MKTIKPSGVFVFAKPTEADKVTKSGIHLSESAREAPKTAVVMETGPSVNPLTCQKNDTIIYKDYTTTEIKLEGETYIVLDQQDILGRIVGVEG